MAEITDTRYYILIKKKDDMQIDRISWDGEKETIISAKSLGRDVALTGFKVSRDDRFLAYYYSITGADSGKVRIINPRDKTVIDELEGSIGNIVFLGENKYYYSRFYRKEKTPDGVLPPTTRIFIRENKEENMIFGEGVPTSYFIWFFEDILMKNIIIDVSHGWNEDKIYGRAHRKTRNLEFGISTKGFPARPINHTDAYYLYSSR